MFGGDQARLLQAYSLMFSLPGSPILWYGEELGMGETSHWENATRCALPCSGTSGTPNPRRISPVPPWIASLVADGGPFDYHRINVQNQRRDPQSLLNQIERVICNRKKWPHRPWFASPFFVPASATLVWREALFDPYLARTCTK